MDQPTADNYVPKRILVTGGAGFMYDLNCSLTYLDSIKDNPNYEFVRGDIRSSDLVALVLKNYNIDTVLHFAAQTHVDNSFQNSLSFTKNNVVGTHVLLEECRRYGNIKRFIHVSTDEVYGESAYDEKHATEHSSLLLPTNPYSASKAAAEHIVLSYYKSYKFPIIITRGNNVYGPHQYPEKVIPKWILLLQSGKKCPIHGNGSNVRAFLYVTDVANAFELITHKGEIGQIYNISSSDEMTNLQLCQYLGKKFGHTVESEFMEYTEDRAINDLRYFICDEKLRKMGWIQKVPFEEGITKTMEWYKSCNLEQTWGENVAEFTLRAHPRVPDKL